ncbi:MAG: hypothetical protein WCY82_09910, partial [Desulfotomaculaceae bacterium]
LPQGLANGLVRQKKLVVLKSRYGLEKLDYCLHYRHDDPRPLIPALVKSCLKAADFEAGGVFF